MYQFFLIHVQQPQIVYIAGVWELNMETCVSVCVGQGRMIQLDKIHTTADFLLLQIYMFFGQTSF